MKRRGGKLGGEREDEKIKGNKERKKKILAEEVLETLNFKKTKS